MPEMPEMVPFSPDEGEEFLYGGLDCCLNGRVVQVIESPGFSVTGPADPRSVRVGAARIAAAPATPPRWVMGRTHEL